MITQDENRIDSLPAEPLLENNLKAFLEIESVVAVWVPTHRAAEITGTISGRYQGDIMKFYIEFEDRWRKVLFEFGEGTDNGWYKEPIPTMKSEELAEMVKEKLDEKYRRLSDM